MPKSPPKPLYGGMAVMEGVMFKGPHKASVAVRAPDGHIEVQPLSPTGASRFEWMRKVPFVRGVWALWELMSLGLKAMRVSAKISLGEEESDLAFNLGTAFAFMVAILLFMLTPTVIAGWLFTPLKDTNPILLHFIEGLFRILIFVAYVYAVSFMSDVKRVFRYHGAEHMVVHAFEHDAPLVPAEVSKFSTVHPRCGTTFLFTFLIIAVIIHSFTGWPNPWLRLLWRVALILPIAMVSYEVFRLGRYFTPLIIPGLMLQKVTTAKPDGSMIEVAIKAFEAVRE
ncbi:MAG: DUF1385 domain-containing protein [bacterium]